MIDQDIVEARRLLEHLSLDSQGPEAQAKIADLGRALLSYLYGCGFKSNPSDGSSASFEDPGVRDARHREYNRQYFAQMLEQVGTTRFELESLGVDSEVFPD